ncbi:DUF664 domain-containing protein [Zhihengliuella halotolerans]|uniref:Uncharacterized protein DUF664 n=1 Tax=Zhihengliuella halotolerans TaxID=370736 RepID=A0A4Q8AE17_9MICC|nr:DUF664 domain-containing protein [Zhihengliuella halotolerans]RZU62502.1 uncharacterized protein DUF664 [Zhihengliuella halotolerans]
MAVGGREPRLDSPDAAVQLAAYLDYYRASVEGKLAGLDDAALRTSRLPSGWTPIELLAHLVHMEQRWFVWGFLAEDVEAPWGDHAGGAATGPWAVPADAGRAEADALIHRLHEIGRRTTEILGSTPLETRGRLGGRFTEEPAPRLAWIGFHVLQEYARHAGHLDIVRELEDGARGE